MPGDRSYAAKIRMVDRHSAPSRAPPEGVGEMEEPYVRPWMGRDIDWSVAPIARFAALRNEERQSMLKDSYPGGKRRNVENFVAQAKGRIGISRRHAKKRASS